MPFILVFHAETQVFEAEALLNEKGIPCQLVSPVELPKSIGDVCGNIAILVEDKKVVEIFPNAIIVEISNEMLGIM